ncbi:HET-domain-containing protein, partial [Cryphonectria parasitica EP155]
MTQRRIVHRSFDAALPRAWLTHCQGHHPECSPKRPVPQTNLIDCIERNIVPSSFAQDKRFIALSYVWGKAPSKQQQQTQPTSSSSAALGLPVPLPHTIADAMTVTQALGFRYLWVDQYCINQTDPADKARQISQMDLIYKCADLTIIAAAGDSHDYGLPGVGERPRSLPEPFILDDRFKFGVHPLRETTWRQSTWNSRAWTFQEGQLPRRRLLFAEEGMVFECAHPAGGVQVENHVSIDCAGDDAALVQQFEEQSSKSLIARMGIGSQLLSLDLDTSNNDLTCLGEKLVSCFVQYLDLLKEYCKRELSFPSDGLHAFQGVANVFEKAPLPVYNVAGIPFIVAGETGSQLQVSSAEASFAYGLAWTTWTSRQPSAQDGSFPSWT